jgi:hypothetical protein
MAGWQLIGADHTPTVLGDPGLDDPACHTPTITRPRRTNDARAPQSRVTTGGPTPTVAA